MSNQVREQIIRIIANNRCDACNNCGAPILNCNPQEVADQVFASLKEAGWVKLADDMTSIKYGIWQVRIISGDTITLPEGSIILDFNPDNLKDKYCTDGIITYLAPEGKEETI